MGRYLVFARTDYAEPLRHHGEIEAEANAVQSRAIEQFGDQWLEFVLIPEDEVQWVLREQTEAEATA